MNRSMTLLGGGLNPDIKMVAIWPEIALGVGAIILLMIEVFSERSARPRFGFITLGIIAIVAALELSLIGEGFSAFAGHYRIDNFAIFIKSILLLAAAMAILVSIDYNSDNKIDYGEYYALILLALLGGFALVSGANLMTIFVGLETMSISLYALVGFTRSNLKSNEAALKYFILGALAASILLYGIALVYGATGSLDLDRIAATIDSSDANRSMLIVALILILTGLAFKVAAVPFHMWAPDTYQGAPTPITAFMSTGVKAAALAVMIRILNVAFGDFHENWSLLIAILAVLAMTVGNLFALIQRDVKRMLAYSSISHVGYLLIAVAVATPNANGAIFYYLLAYTFINIGAFATVAIIAGVGEKRTGLDDFAGLGFRRPVIAMIFAIALLALAGVPPTSGFMAKLYIFMAALEGDFLWLAIVGALNAALSLYYYLRVTVYLYMKPASPQAQFDRVITPAMSVALILTLYGALALGIFPNRYLELAKEAILTTFL